MANTTSLKRTAAKKILVVEDEGEMALLLNIALNDTNFQLDYVNNLTSADEYLQQQEPSIVLLDNKLPDGYGVDFISYMRKKYPAIKIVMISGFSSVRDVALENGADKFFEKPFSKQQLCDSISELSH